MRRVLLPLAGAALCVGALGAPPPVPISATALGHPGPSERGSSIVLYSNITYPDPNGYYMSQESTGWPFGDDLHMASGGLMDGFAFVYYDPPGDDQLSELEFRFYANDADNSDYPGSGSPGSPLLGTYTVSDLPGDGRWLIRVDVSGDPLEIPKDIWMEVNFLDNLAAGLALYHPPTVGSSFDLFEIYGQGIFWT
jgi:hypothetical protein